MKDLIRKILKESEDEFDWINHEVNPSKEFLYNKFMECKLEPVKNKEWLGWTRYVDKNGKILFLDNIETGDKDTVLYFNYHEIHKKLKEMGLNYEEMKKLSIDMLYETHKRKVLTAIQVKSITKLTLYETHKRKVLTASDRPGGFGGMFYETHKRKVLTASNLSITKLIS